jgi:hypothetical protein
MVAAARAGVTAHLPIEAAITLRGGVAVAMGSASQHLRPRNHRGGHRSARGDRERCLKRVTLRE